MIFVLIMIKSIIGDSMTKQERYINNKIFRTLDEQIDILKSKGLVIDDVDFAKQILLRENYFFINGYRHLLLKSKADRKFIPNTNFTIPLKHLGTFFTTIVICIPPLIFFSMPTT